MVSGRRRRPGEVSRHSVVLCNFVCSQDTEQEDGAVTCGRLTLTSSTSSVMENQSLSPEPFFEIVSIERSDDGNFEAVLEASDSRTKGARITEKDIKCLEEKMKEANDDIDNCFSKAVLKFQEAVEQYSKNICERLPKCILDDGIGEELFKHTDADESFDQSSGQIKDKFMAKDAIECLNSNMSENSQQNKTKCATLYLKEVALLLGGFIWVICFLLPENLDEVFHSESESVAVGNILDEYIELTKLSEVPLRK